MESLITKGVALPTRIKHFTYTLYSTRKLWYELEHHRSYKKEVNPYFRFVRKLEVYGLLHYSTSLLWCIFINFQNHNIQEINKHINAESAYMTALRDTF